MAAILLGFLPQVFTGGEGRAQAKERDTGRQKSMSAHSVGTCTQETAFQPQNHIPIAARKPVLAPEFAPAAVFPGWKVVLTRRGRAARYEMSKPGPRPDAERCSCPPSAILLQPFPSVAGRRAWRVAHTKRSFLFAGRRFPAVPRFGEDGQFLLAIMGYARPLSRPFGGISARGIGAQRFSPVSSRLTKCSRIDLSTNKRRPRPPLPGTRAVRIFPRGTGARASG